MCAPRLLALQAGVQQGGAGQALAAQGIRYVFVGDSLGGRPDDPACYVDSRVDYDRVRDSPSSSAASSACRRPTPSSCGVVLMCSEGKPEQCHRTKLIGETLVALGIPVVHIDEADRLITTTRRSCG